MLVVDKSSDYDKPYFDSYVFMLFYHNINVKKMFLNSEPERHIDASSVVET